MCFSQNLLVCLSHITKEERASYRSLLTCFRYEFLSPQPQTFCAHESGMRFTFCVYSWNSSAIVCISCMKKGKSQKNGENYAARRFMRVVCRLAITVAARSKAWTVFARSDTGVMGSNPTRGMDICVRLFCACVVLCVGSGLATGWSPS
jgi:hypothetical protein